MQYKSSNESMSDTLHLHSLQNNFLEQAHTSVSIDKKLNSTTQHKLSLKDKAGLVFVVVVLLMLQLLEKVKLLK